MYTLKFRHSQSHIGVYLKVDMPNGLPEITQSAEIRAEILSPDVLAFIDNLNKNPESMRDFLSQFNPVVDKALSDPKTALSIEDKIFANYKERLNTIPTGQRLRVEKQFTKFMNDFSMRVAENLGDEAWKQELQAAMNSTHQQVALTQDRYSQLLNPTT